jgi:hypothetical protein
MTHLGSHGNGSQTLQITPDNCPASLNLRERTLRRPAVYFMGTIAHHSSLPT